MEEAISYIDLGFNQFGLNLPINQSFRSANLNDAFFETSEASIGNSKLKNLSVSDAKIESLSADKITAGTLSAVTNVGDDSIVLDGKNRVIKVYDASGNVSVYIAGGSA